MGSSHAQLASSMAHEQTKIVWKRILFNAFSPIVHTTAIENADRFNRKRIHLKTLSRVETSENGAPSY